jgi:YbbR domain-containing protein
MLTEKIQYGPFDAPAGTVVASVTVTATDALGNHIGTSVAPSATTATLTLTSGTWTVTAQAVDASGNAVGPVATDPVPYVVAATTVTVQVPVSLTGTNV